MTSHLKNIVWVAQPNPAYSGLGAFQGSLLRRINEKPNGFKGT